MILQIRMVLNSGWIQGQGGCLVLIGKGIGRALGCSAGNVLYLNHGDYTCVAIYKNPLNCTLLYVLTYCKKGFSPLVFWVFSETQLTCNITLVSGKKSFLKLKKYSEIPFFTQQQTSKNF